MSTPQPQAAAPPRMLWWLFATLVLMVAARHFATADAGGLFAVSLYKCHLMSLGGWGGYWLDRALFPYARPHSYVADEQPREFAPQPRADGTWYLPEQPAAEVPAAEAAHDYPLSMLRRAIIVAACLVCVGLGA